VLEAILVNLGEFDVNSPSWNCNLCMGPDFPTIPVWQILPVFNALILSCGELRRIMPKAKREREPMNPGNANSIQNLLNSTSIYWLGLGVALIAMALVIHYLRAWYRDRDDRADTNDKLVDQMEELRRQGDLSDEEYRSIKGQVSARKNS